jgi:hypothetical protein
LYNGAVQNQLYTTTDEGFVKSFDHKATIIEIPFFLNIMEKKVLKKILVSFLLNLKHDTLILEKLKL